MEPVKMTYSNTYCPHGFRSPRDHTFAPKPTSDGLDRCQQLATTNPSLVTETNGNPLTYLKRRDRELVP
ncbi:hypothetical protein LIA77_00777 [Sarocladium implicatum]|nr:hypothetical protein LIA77_00777 [Sarocladium implicatum]